MKSIAIPAGTPALYAQDGKGYEAIVHAHIFLPGHGADWFITEYDPETRIAFGWAEVAAGCGELGYSSIDEIESICLPITINGVEIPRALWAESDLYWQPVTLTEALRLRAVARGEVTA